MLRQRLISGTLLAAALVGLVILDGYLSSKLPQPALPPTGRAADLRFWLLNGALWTTILLVLTVLTIRELLAFARASGLNPFGRLAFFFAAGLTVGPYIAFNHELLFGWKDESWAMIWIAIALGLGFYLQAARHRTEHAMANLAVTIFIIFYTGGLAGFWTGLRMEVGGWQGATIVLFSIFCVKITDIGAFFIGSRFGRKKLIEWLSPKKTWEGFFGGLASAVLGSVLLGMVLIWTGAIQPDFRPRLPGPTVPVHPVLALAIFGLLMGAISVAGDLCASLLKRDAAVKDSGRVIPGMGGILDVIDSPLLAAPVAWFFWTRIF